MEQVARAGVIRTMKKSFAFPALLAAFLFLAGCATYTPTDRASISLVGIESAESTILETTLVMTLRLTNETNVPLHVTGTSHKLTLNGEMVGHGVNNGALEVPALGSVTIPLTVRLDNLELLRQFGHGRIPEEISYRMNTRMFTTDAIDGVPVITEGKLDLRPFANSLMLN